MDGKITVEFTGKITPVKTINKQFTLCKCRVMALGENQKKIFFSKEAVDDALPSLYNVPVVGHLFVNKDGEYQMGGHDLALEKDNSGKYQFRWLAVPYGVVPQQDSVYYEDVKEQDGTVNTYLVADVILWTGRYPELLGAKYSDETWFAQSMEIVPYETSKRGEYLSMDRFQYSALCLLGKSDDRRKNRKPCFDSAAVEPYKFSAVSEEWSKLLGEFKDELAKCYEKRDEAKGEKRTLDNETIKKILLEFNLAEDTTLPFEVGDDMTEETFRAKIVETYFSEEKETADEPGEVNEAKEEAKEETVVTDENPNADEGKEQIAEPAQKEVFSAGLTYEERRKEINSALNSLSFWGENEYRSYYLTDFDNAYIYSHYFIGGETITQREGTTRIPYSFMDKGVSLDISKAEEVRAVWLTKAEEDKLAEDKEEMESLVEFRRARIEDDRRKEYAAVISEFSADLGEIDEFKIAVKDAMSFENVGAFTEKLYAIRGKYAKKPAKKPLDSIRIPIGFENLKQKQSEMDRFMSEYLSKAKK